MADDSVAITTRSRNLGYGWTNRPTGIRSEICDPVESVRGGLRSIEYERNDAIRINSGGTYWREDMYVAGRRITAVWGSYDECVPECDYDTADGRNPYPCDKSTCWHEGWVNTSVSDLLGRLRNREENVLVRLEDL